MMVYLPTRGWIFELASRYVDPSLGFALGWTYFLTGAILVCVEYSAVVTVMQCWVPAEQVNPAAWIAMALVICFVLNIGAVKYYGENAFVMAITKMLLIISLILLTFITMVSGNPRRDAYGFRNWTNGQAMHSYYRATTGPTGRFYVEEDRAALVAVDCIINSSTFTLNAAEACSQSLRPAYSCGAGVEMSEIKLFFHISTAVLGNAAHPIIHSTCWDCGDTIRARFPEVGLLRYGTRISMILTASNGGPGIPQKSSARIW